MSVAVRIRQAPPLGLITIGFMVASVLLAGGCALSSVRSKAQSTGGMTAKVSALYNDGAAAFHAGNLNKAQDKYQAALEQARVLKDELGIGYSLAGIGAVHQRLKEYPEALEYYSMALRHFIQSGNLVRQGLALAAIGEVHIQRGSAANAIGPFDQALAIGERLIAEASPQDQSLILSVRANLLAQKAGAHAELRQWTEAVENYRRAAADYRMVGNVEMAGRSLSLAAGFSHLKMEEPQLAAGLYAEAWVLLKEAGKIGDAFEALLQVGWSDYASGHLREAAAVFAEVVTLAERESVTSLVVRGHLGLGETYHALVEWERALAHYQAALQRLRQGDWKGEPLLEPTILVLRGKIYRWLTQYEEAIEHFRLAAVKYREARDRKGEADVLKELADVFAWLLDFQAAMLHYGSALELYRADGNVAKQVTVLAALAEVAWASEDHRRNEVNQYLQRGRYLLDSLGTSKGVDPTKPLVEITIARLKRFSEEREQLVQTLRRDTPSLDPEEAAVTAYLFFLLEDSKPSFQELQKKALFINEEYLLAAGTLYQKWATLLLHSGDSKSAIELLVTANMYHTAVRPNRDVSIQWAKDWFISAVAYHRQKDFAFALYFLRLAEVTARFLRTPEIHRVYSAMAQVYADMGQTDVAVDYYTKALGMLESVQSFQGIEETKIGVQEGTLNLYWDFATLLLDVHAKSGDEQKIRDAFQLTEAGRARAFLDMLGKSSATRLAGEVGSLAREGEATRRQIARIYEQLRAPDLEKAEEARLLEHVDRLRQKWQTLQREAARQSPRYNQIAFPRIATVGDVQNTLSAESVLLEYSIGYKRSTLWAISKDQVRAYSLPGLESMPFLDQYLQTLRMPLLQPAEISRHLALGQELYRSLIGPAEEQIREKRHLIIAADGPLHYLPFEVLIAGKTNGSASGMASLAEAPYLLKQFRVTYVPSASVLVTQHNEWSSRNRAAPFPILAFGDPVYRQISSPEKGSMAINTTVRNSNLSRLEFSEEEVLSIAKMWNIPSDSPHINLRERASVRRVREVDLSQYRTVHFAAHAVLADELKFATQPALVLSQDSDDPSGLLQFSDILELKLSADLVVLSACNTHLGRLREGEGVVGLTRAFLYAGASSVAVSLWKVEDQATSIIMTKFYSRLRNGYNKGEALRQAKLEMLRTVVDHKGLGERVSLASPFFWAAFILVGEWE